MLFLSCFLLCFRERLFIDAFKSHAGKGLTSWLSFVMSNCEVVSTIGILDQVWCLIVSIPDICPFFLLCPAFPAMIFPTVQIYG